MSETTRECPLYDPRIPAGWKAVTWWIKADANCHHNTYMVRIYNGSRGYGDYEECADPWRQETALASCLARLKARGIS